MNSGLQEAEDRTGELGGRAVQSKQDEEQREKIEKWEDTERAL